MLTFSAGERTLDEYVAFVADRFAGTVRKAAKSVPVMIGEWCLDTASKESSSLTDGERSTYFGAIADAQLRAWEPAVAWTYWSYSSDDRSVIQGARELGLGDMDTSPPTVARAPRSSNESSAER